MDKVTSQAKPTLNANPQTDAHIATDVATKAATKAKPVSPNYWASLLLPMALIAVVG